MPAPKHSQSAPHNVITCARALRAQLGWLLAPALMPVSAEGKQDGVRIEAELRAGERPAAPVAEVASTQASLRALSARIRSGSQQPLATSASLSALLIPLHAPSLAQQQGTIAPTQAAVRGIVRWHWPLLRSTCDAEEEPSTSQGASCS